MTTNRALTLAIAGVIGIIWITSGAGTGAVQQTGNAVRIDNDDIGGVVTGPRGPEAGVWVIAETTDLPTRFSRTVVTDEQGRYLVPDLPKANYSVWVRGYGLVDSSKVQSAPGRVLNLTALTAPNPRAAAEYYPAAYWYSLVQVPAKNEFPGTGPEGNGINPNMKTQADWIRMMKSGGCTTCHQLGTKGTREIPAALGTFASGAAAWERRVQSGQAGSQMSNGLDNMGGRSRCMVTGPIGLPRASFHLLRRDPKAWSETWWSPSGTGRIRKPTSTMSSQPTGGIRGSTPTDRCTARSS
jgi:hypothetical protein